jgi:chorismate binding enzyme
LSITIRTAVCQDGLAHFNVGAGIVADSNPEAEYEETLAEAGGFLAALDLTLPAMLPNIQHMEGARLVSVSIGAAGIAP